VFVSVPEGDCIDAVWLGESLPPVDGLALSGEPLSVDGDAVSLELPVPLLPPDADADAEPLPPPPPLFGLELGGFWKIKMMINRASAAMASISSHDTSTDTQLARSVRPGHGIGQRRQSPGLVRPIQGSWKLGPLTAPSGGVLDRSMLRSTRSTSAIASALAS